MTKQKSRLVRLVGTDYALVPFRNLERPYQLAMAHYMAVDGEAWSFPEGCHMWPTRDQQLRALRRYLPHFIENYGDKLFGVVLLPSKLLQQYILQDPDIAQDHQTWEAYRARYADNCDIPNHRKAQRWPVILSDFEHETIQDGSHRLHCYLRRGDETIPAIFYPRAHQVRAYRRGRVAT